MLSYSAAHYSISPIYAFIRHSLIFWRSLLTKLILVFVAFLHFSSIIHFFSTQSLKNFLLVSQYCLLMLFISATQFIALLANKEFYILYDLLISPRLGQQLARPMFCFVFYVIVFLSHLFVFLVIFFQLWRILTDLIFFPMCFWAVFR